ncbi:MAG: hypothetical protein WC428_06410 [Candidatus Paceibacterota bacterium]|jgi:hypothetical protein
MSSAELFKVVLDYHYRIQVQEETIEKLMDQIQKNNQQNIHEDTTEKTYNIA